MLSSRLNHSTHPSASGLVPTAHRNAIKGKEFYDTSLMLEAMNEVASTVQLPNVEFAFGLKGGVAIEADVTIGTILKTAKRKVLVLSNDFDLVYYYAQYPSFYAFLPNFHLNWGKNDLRLNATEALLDLATTVPLAVRQALDIPEEVSDQSVLLFLRCSRLLGRSDQSDSVIGTTFTSWLKILIANHVEFKDCQTVADVFRAKKFNASLCSF